MTYRLSSKDKSNLRAVRKRIDEKSSYAICNALFRLGAKETQRLRAAIRNSLEGSLFITDWLGRNHPQFYARLCQNHKFNTTAAMRTYRLAWIDHMLEKGSV